MQYQTFSPDPQDSYPIAFLVPKLSQRDMEVEYLDPGCIKAEEAIAYKLFQSTKKTSAEQQREFLSDLLPVLNDMGTKYLVVSDGDYFKTLTGVKKTEAYLGYVLPNVYPADLKGRFNVVYCPNYRQVVYDRDRVRARIKQALDALWSHRHGAYREPGCEIIHFSAYPTSVADIASWLDKLIDMDCELTADIEAFSLKHHSAGIGTISFAWNKHEGIAFPVDLGEDPPAVRRLLANFFLRLERKLIWHHIGYDVYVLIYQLFMSDLLDTEGLLHGIDVMLSDWDCTRLIAYLATNSTAGNTLGLKVLAQEFSGNYAVEEIKDITAIPLNELLQYNLVDTLSTWYVKEKYEPIMDADNQRQIYETLFQPAMRDIIQMQLTGLPLNMERVKEVNEILGREREAAIRLIQKHPIIEEFSYLLEVEHVDARNAVLKKKRIKIGEEPQSFNPNSTPQKQRLFYEFLKLPVIELTDTKLPATGAETLEKLKAHTGEKEVRELIDAMLAYAAVDKIYGTFLPPMLEAPQAPDGWHYLYGYFNLGGTVSGRLSSSDPNLQNLPANSKFGKLIKSCVQAPPGWIFAGLDFDSLEDRISALTTRDPNKLKVYTDGFDGHCLRAYSYFEDQITGIDPDSVESINSIAAAYKDLRQASKTPTFLLTYGGTWIGMIAKCGFDEEKAKGIEAKYHELYKVSDEWVATQVEQATHDGYVTVAFGLRVRTPLLANCIWGVGMPFEAEAEGRTAGNALGQSWCMLNSRAGSEFMGKVRKSKYRLDIRPCAQIHDAGYFLLRDDLSVVRYTNTHLVKAVQWQDDPAIWHDQVKLGGSLSLFFPSWANEIGLPNHATESEILATVEKELNKREKKAA